MANNKLLLQGDYPLIASPTLAKAYGVASAVFLQKLHYCLLSSDAKAHNKKKYWFHTLQEWVDTLGVYSISTIKRVVAKLKKEGILIVKKLAQSKWIQTNYYTIDYAKLNQLFQAQVTEDVPTQSKTRVAKEPLPRPASPEKLIVGTHQPQIPTPTEEQLLSISLDSQRFYKALRQSKLDIAYDDPRIDQWITQSVQVIRHIQYNRQASHTPYGWHTPEQLQLDQFNTRTAA